MPGSTAASSVEQTKAKVTESSATNGIFVRPVAVAGIFRPAEESANKPPSLPEKRRFSALSGDLRPCSGASNDDFARRRQSWDTKPKDVPFGQALLRKTPRSTNAPSGSQTQELATNGSSHEDITCNDKNLHLASDEKSSEKLNSKSDLSTSSSTSTSNLSSGAKEITAVKDGIKLGKAQIALQANKDEKLGPKNQNNVPNEISSKTSVKNATDSIFLNLGRKITGSEKSVVSNCLPSETVDKSSNSNDSSKQPKKVYGLIKRDIKSEAASQKSENSASSESKNETDFGKLEKSFVKKESQFELLSKTDNSCEKGVVNSSDSSKNKTKVYGVSKTNFKKEINDNDVNTARPSETVNKPTEHLAVSKISGNTVVDKSPVNKINNKSIESNVSSKISETTVFNKISEVNIVTNKVVNKSFETSVANKVSEIKAVSKLEISDVSKVSDKIIIKPLESNIANKTSEIKVVNKAPGTNTVSKNFENKVTNKSLERNVVNKALESKVLKTLPEANIISKNLDTKVVNKSLETKTPSKTSENKVENKALEKNIVSKNLENKVAGKLFEVNKTSESKIVNKPLDFNIVSKISENQIENKLPEANNSASKTFEIKVINKSSEIVSKESNKKIVNKASEIKSINKEAETISVSPKEVFASKSVDSKVAVETAKVSDKLSNEFQKAQSPPKDFRTVRRTSDVIAAKIQNIFSNISSSDKSTPLLSKKFKTLDKSNANCDNSAVKVVEKTTDVACTVKQIDENNTAISNKSECKLPAESNSDVKSGSKVVAKKPPVTDPQAKNDTDGSTNKEYKFKEQAPSAADYSSLKKESKLALESRDVLQSCKVGEVVNTPRVNTGVSLEKADSKTEHSINIAPSKTQDKKNLNIGGKMPIKKQDPKNLDGTPSLKATNQDDRKSSDSTSSLKAVMENSNKGLILKTEPSNTCSVLGAKISKSVPSSYSLNTSVNSTVDIKNSYNVCRKIESGVSVKESTLAKAVIVSSSVVSPTTVQQSGAITTTTTTTCVSEISEPHTSEVKKAPRKIVSCVGETTEISKIEVAKITPSTVPGIVPTINVLFRTKSPQSSLTKEENRKKVVVETYASTSPVPSAVINASKVSEKVSIQPASNACESVIETVKTVENASKSLNSPRFPAKHSIVNLKKEELATVNLTAKDSSASEITMPPSTVKINDKCSSVDDSKTETCVNIEKSNVPTPVHPEADKDKSVATITSLNSDSVKGKNTISPGSESGEKVEIKVKHNEKSIVSEIGISSPKTDFQMDKSVISETRVNVVDLDDWSKKFQLPEPEPPRVPLRRRALRESLTPSLPVRSRFGSLKRIDDSPRYIPRSPSQSSLPQRYSYTEMLSKVCSMGVLPYSEPLTPKSCSSSSSQVSELWSELSEEQSTATHTSEMLESETTERMRLEKEVQELQNRCSQVQLRSDKMEMEMMEARVYRTPELNGDLSEDEDVEANSSLYKQKYERAVRDMEIMKRRIQQQHEEEMEQKAMLKKASDKRLAEALEDVEEERQVANQWKRKAQKLGSELQDLRLMLEEQMARNGELEKKQRRFDAELSASQEEIKKERLLREKFAREKDQALHEKYSLEQDLQSAKLDADTLHEKITQLNRELDELTLSSKGEEEVTQLKRAKQELERKTRDQEEELEELAAQASMLEQAKLRLEMSLEKVRQEHRREASVREEEIEEIRASFSKKIKNLEAQLETEQDERHQLMKQKHELERRLYEMADQPPPQDPEIERRLRRDLKRTKALLRDAQSMLEHTREGQSGKTLIRQLKNQLEDSEFAKAAAVKARQAVESELHECQTQLEESTRVKNEVESRCLQLSREKSAIQTQLEEAEEEMAEVMKKYKAVVAQMSIDQKALSEQNQQIADLETEKQMLKDQLSEVSHKFEHLAGQSEDTHKVHRLDGKVRDLESKLELEQTTRSRLEHQIARLKEQNERAREECDSLRNKELQAQEGVRRLQRQMRDLREDYSALQQKEAEAYRKQHELEMALENTETDLQVTKNDLRLACQRIQDLQNALEDDLDSGTDVPDDSGSDSDDSFELSVLRNQSVTPTQRCDSAASNYSLASEGFRSRTSSFTHELSAFSSRNDAESKDLNGLSGMNTSSRLLDVEHDETV